MIKTDLISFHSIFAEFQHFKCGLSFELGRQRLGEVQTEPPDDYAQGLQGSEVHRCPIYHNFNDKFHSGQFVLFELEINGFDDDLIPLQILSSAYTYFALLNTMFRKSQSAEI